MLGLRRSPFSRSSSANPDRSTSTSSTVVAEPKTVDDNPKNPEAIFKMQDQTPIAKSAGIEQSNGLTNGVTSYGKNHGNNSSAQHSGTNEYTTSFSTEQQITHLHESVIITRQKFIADLDDVEESSIDNITTENVLEYIERQRLTYMPHRGSHWDKVLKWAEFFALQISNYAVAVEPFVSESKVAAKLIWTASQSLLNLGPENAQALETTFGVFYRLGLSVSMFLRDSTILSANDQIRKEAGQTLNTILLLVRDITFYYRLKLRGSARETSFNFNGVFGGQVAAFYQRRNHIVDSMWEYALGNNPAMDVRVLRKWLGPHDAGLQRLLKSDDSAPGQREEFTCEWFQSNLLSFSRSKNDTLVIHGPAGCGKSVLSGWIVERLQRPIGKKAHITLSCTLEADIPSEHNSLALVKRLLLQVLENDIGHKKFFMDLVSAYRVSMSNDLSNFEKMMWDCLDTGLRHLQDANHVMIVVDGLDDSQVGEKAVRTITNKLGSLSAKCSNLQLIMVSQHSVKPDKGKTQSFAITADHTHEDLRLVIDHCLAEFKYFSSRSEHARENLVEQLLQAAKGNFLWAILTAALVKRETSDEAFTKAVKAAKEAPVALDATIAKLTNSVDFSKPEVGLLTSLMLVASRPLKTLELKHLAQIDLSKRHTRERETDIEQDIKTIFGPLVVIRDGFVRFCHPTIRSYLLQIQHEGKKLRTRQAAHSDIATRLLAYCKFSLPMTREPSFDLTGKHEVDKMFSTHVLLEYAVRNWTMHFQSSTMGQDLDALDLGDDFKAIFPNTTRLVMLEWACWGRETSRMDAVKMLEVALYVRQAALSENHVSVLQNLIVCGNIWREATHTTEAAECFYRASVVGQQILSKYHPVIASCNTAFLAITESMDASSRTELVTHKEELLIYTIEMCKYQHGKTHDTVIRYYKMLAQLYVQIHEETKAETIWFQLREIVIMRFGKGSKEEISIAENLTVVLKKGDKKTDVIEYEHGIFDLVTELEVWDIRRIKLTIELARSYEARGELLMAEELYIFLWRRLTEQCHRPHHHHGVDIHIHLLDIVIEYVGFLTKCNRHEEASNILICIWTEYEEYDFESEVIFLRLKTVGELMRTVSLLSVAVSVFKKCWTWFKSRGKHEHITSCELLISETVEEISTISTTGNTSTRTTTITETVRKEIFESTLSRSIVTKETISVCKSLITHYMKTEQWSLAIEVSKRSLLVIWKSIVSSAGTIALPKDFSAGAIDIAISLAVCHHRSQHFHEAEAIYIRIYRACRNSCRIDDERLIKSYTVLIRFYQEHQHWYKMVEIYRELLEEYRVSLGASHHLTIRTLYILGSLCTEHGCGPAHEYYAEIIKVLNHGSHVCHHDALDAMMFMCRYHYEAGHWKKLQAVCKILWETWKGQHRGHDKFTMDFVEILYFRYRYVLEYHIHCELSILRDLTIEYRNTCIKVFGATSAITIKAMVELAQICMRSEKHTHEAITLYEEVLTHTKSTKTTSVISTTTITTVKKRLTEAYVSVCKHDSASTTTIERAFKIVLERYEYLRATYGWAHTETLITLREFVLLHIRSKKQESHLTVVRILLEAISQIVVKERHSQTLHEAGRTIGHIFMDCGISHVALELIHEMRLQIITGEASSDNKHGIKLDKSAGRLSFVFLVTLEQVVNGALSVSYSQVMADYLTESVLYESYNRSLKSSATNIIGHAARLRAFLLSHDRHSQRDVLEQHSYDVFVKKWAINTRSREIGMLFYRSLLVQIGDNIRDVRVGDIACTSSAVEVRRLLEHGQAQKAFEVAECALDFINHQRSYHHIQNVPAGFKLSALMAARGIDQSAKAKIDPKLREPMFELSRKIIREVLQACKDSKIDFVRLKLHELNDLIGLLGEQQNFADLEWILSLLWASREVQSNWKPATIIAIGRLFVQARYMNASKERKSEAIRLCEDICYNMRRTWGSLDPKTLEMSDLLSELYTSMGHYREAQGVHENILRLVVEGDDGDDRTLDTMDVERAKKQLDLLKQSFLRLHGWDKSPEVYVELVQELKHMPEYQNTKEWKDVRPPSEWNAKEPASETAGKFRAPSRWDFVESETEEAEKQEAERRRPRKVQRATSNWGLGLVNRFLGQGQTNGAYTNGNTDGNVRGKKSMMVDDDEGFASAEEGVGNGY